MKIINEAELSKVNGGFSGWAIAGICLIVTFIAGVIDGIARPKGCNG